MRNFASGILLLGLALATHASVQLQHQQPQQPSKRTGNDVTTEEEPHPYTISFFLFPHGAASQLLGGGGKAEKKDNVETHKHNKTSQHKAKANGTASSQPLGDDGLDSKVNYQLGSVKHPKSEMYPACHQCPKNSSYHECIQKKTLTTCRDGLANICYTRSDKRDTIVHYEMGCASHKQCQRARAKPCKLNEKRCFTCCQWSGCNSQSHHHKNFPFAVGRDAETELSFRAGVTSASVTWALLVASLLACLVF